MQKTLILTEKKLVAQDYAKVLLVQEEKEGKFENDQYVITWCQGHLVEMAYPEQYDEKYKKWKIEDLPFLPEEFRYEIKESLKNRYKVVHTQLHRKDIDTVMFCGDAGREGEYIYRLILLKGGMRAGVNALRVWIDSTTKEAILQGIQDAKPISEYDNLSNAGFLRSIEDYLVGMNFSRLLTVKYGQKFNSTIKSTKWKSIDVGRVMSCVLGMVVRREREILNFKETAFYKVVADIKGVAAEWKTDENSAYVGNPLVYKDNSFLEKEIAQKLCEELKDKSANIEKIETFLSNKKAPLLYNLAELQNDCTEKFKISPDDTLEIAQTLYENALITYPRTDARVLSSAIAKTIKANIEGLKSYEPVADFADKIIQERKYDTIEKSHYTDDSKISDHYAIIPTGNLEKLNNMNELQKKVYELIVRRFLSIFFAPAVYKNAKIRFRIGQEAFHTSCKVIMNYGYMEVVGKETEEKEENTGLLAYIETAKEGDIEEVTSYSIKEGKTTPPKRYTSGSMILAMENAGNLIEDRTLREQIKGCGIGTSATRAEIIKKLVKKGYIELNTKTQIIKPHSDGFAIFDIINEVMPDLLSPDITAEWEQKLDEIRKGTLKKDVCQKEIEEYIRKTVETIKGMNEGKNFEGDFQKKELGKCPLCHKGTVVVAKFGYACTQYKKETDPCYFAIGQVAEKFLSEQEVKKLIEDGTTGIINGFKSKSGTTFRAALDLDKNAEDKKKFLTFRFEESKTEHENIKCPLCNGHIVKTSFGYGCSNYKKTEEQSCTFTLNSKIAGKNISEKQIKKMITQGETELLEGFVSKNGKKFSAILYLEQGKVKFKFPNS